LLKDRPVQLVLGRSSSFPEGIDDDFQLPYLKYVLSFIGLESIKALVLEGTTLPQVKRETLIAKHCELARMAGADF